MFDLKLKKEIAEKVQKILRETQHFELPEDEIQFILHVDGASEWSWTNIRNNNAVNRSLSEELEILDKNLKLI